MSHVEDVAANIDDLAALETAAKECGCELVRGQKTYRWYGQHVGDYAMPEGVTEADLGKCDHAIRVKDADSRTYEIGVVAKPEGGYRLLYDFWQGGYGLMDKVGEKCTKLTTEYGVAKVCANAYKHGYTAQRVEQDGKTYVDVYTR